jgi:signal transduction histidine kinase
MTRQPTGAFRKALLCAAFVLCALTAAGCAVLAWFLFDGNFYTTPKERILSRFVFNQMKSDAYSILSLSLDPADTRQEPEEPVSVTYSPTATNLRYELTDANGEVISSNISSGAGTDWTEIVLYATKYRNTDNSGETFLDISFVKPEGHMGSYYPYSPRAYTFRGTVAEDLPVQDGYRFTLRLYGLAYDLRYTVIPVGVAAVLLCVLCYIVLMCLSARRPRQTGLFPGPLHKVPFDLLLCAAAVPVLLVVWICKDLNTSSWLFWAIFGMGCAVFFLCVFLGLSVSAAARIKTGTLFTNTVIWRALSVGRKLLLAGWRLLGRLFGLIGKLIRGIPLVWKTALALVILAVLDFIVFAASYPDFEVYFIYHILLGVILIPAVLWTALCMRRLEKGGKALAEGDLSRQIDTRGMFFSFKRHGEHLNAVGEGINRAVEERMKSERMKTELITNVSHDIKTPLTSIINYAGLIAGEECENEKILEYSAVLLRQSGRLKKLIDDLVEASKAQSGALEIELAPADACVFVEQAAGEYEGRLNDVGLTLVTSCPDHPVPIRADGRRLWRVFDNLMNNILKYGQSGTRVYLTLEDADGLAAVTFRNVSRDPLNLSPDELMERFVRGDASRNSATDGNGLGLSIAKSLTELQGGHFDLSIDGDLFKVRLTFRETKAEAV